MISALIRALTAVSGTGLLLLSWTFPAGAQPFAVSRGHPVGGVLTMSAGPYSMRSTHGQARAGQSAGGPYNLRAGFWAGTDPGGPSAAPDPAPDAFRIHAVTPNPLTPAQTASIRFGLRAAGPVHLMVFDSRGALVRLLQDDILPAGDHEVRWAGTDDQGRRVASGVYFIQLRTGGAAGLRKVTVLP